MHFLHVASRCCSSLGRWSWGFKLQVHSVLSLIDLTLARVCWERYSRCCDKASAAWSGHRIVSFDPKVTEAMMPLLQSFAVDGGNQLWVIPLLPKRAENNERYAQLKTKVGPVDKTCHVSVRSCLVPQSREINPDQFVSISLQLCTYLVCGASVNTPVAVPDRRKA